MSLKLLKNKTYNTHPKYYVFKKNDKYSIRIRYTDMAIDLAEYSTSTWWINGSGGEYFRTTDFKKIMNKLKELI